MSARVEEIRTENHHGDVSSSDIEWLCKVADVAERVAQRSDPGKGAVLIDYRDLDTLRRLFA